MSLRKAIDAQCRSCIYDPNERGSALAQVRACTSFACPLYPVRPGAAKAPRSAAQVAAGRAAADRLSQARKAQKTLGETA